MHYSFFLRMRIPVGAVENVWHSWSGHEYLFDSAKRDWASAQLQCQAQHGDLAVINTDAEQIFLKNLTRQT